MKKSIYLYIYLSICLSVSLNGQSTNSQDVEKGKSIQRNATYNLEEIKVRWKKAALENCTGVPCVPFNCGTSTISDIDGNSYNTVLIGTQCWTKENLKVTKYNDGTTIPDETANTAGWGGLATGARTEYVAAGVTGYVGTFGYLYNWYAVNDLRKLCPAGWHVPTDAEWTIMIQTLDPSQAVNSGNVSTFTGVQSSTAGTVMKSTVTNSSIGSGLGWNPGSPGTNTSGFTALPGGCRSSVGSFNFIRINAFFWSATEVANFYAWYRSLIYNNSIVNRNYNASIGIKSSGASVRCLRD